MCGSTKATCSIGNGSWRGGRSKTGSLDRAVLAGFPGQERLWPAEGIENVFASVAGVVDGLGVPIDGRGALSDHE